jgi:hypothetical protein
MRMISRLVQGICSGFVFSYWQGFLAKATRVSLTCASLISSGDANPESRVEPKRGTSCDLRKLTRGRSHPPLSKVGECKSHGRADNGNGGEEER